MKTHMPKESRKAQAGFTLFDALAAVALLSFGLLAVAAMQGTATRGNYTASLHTEGTGWAKDKMEELLAQPYGTLQALIGTPGQEVQKIYTIQWNVTGGPVANTLTVTVTANWNDKGGSKSTTLTCVKNNV